MLCCDYSELGQQNTLYTGGTRESLAGAIGTKHVGLWVQYYSVCENTFVLFCECYFDLFAALCVTEVIFS